MKRPSTLVKIYWEDKLKLDKLRSRVQNTEGNPNIKTPEILRRTLNIPTLPKILEDDALEKKLRKFNR